MSFLKSLETMQNAGLYCKHECLNESTAIDGIGPCIFCGTEGFCCKRDGNVINGCDGFMGGSDKYECSKMTQGSNL